MPDQHDPEQKGTDSFPTEHDDESLLDKMMPEGFKRRIEAGVESVLKDGRLKSLMGELKLPKEIVAHMISQVDDTKQAAVAVIARETRLFLEKTNLSEEIVNMLSKISLEVKTQVRFVPNEDSMGEKGGIKLDIKGPTVSSITRDDDDVETEGD
jgi:hypothetical protein